MYTSTALRLAAVLLLCGSAAIAADGQGGGNFGSINGTVQDSTGAVFPGAKVEIHNPVSGYDESATTDSTGHFSFSNVPFNPYHLTVVASGFNSHVQDVEVRSVVPETLTITLKVATSTETVTVSAEGGDLVENDSAFHTDVDKNLLDKMPLGNQSSQLSAIVTNSSPGIAADSNGQIHGLGDHAENSISLDNQPITDQTSKVFSNQLPLNAVQSMEIISGAPPAEYGDKTSVVMNVTTRSGVGMTTPHGSVTASYGSFGSSTVGFDLAYGGPKWGNFISAGGLNTGRFLDTPEFEVIHDKGNEQNFFDRVDFQLSTADSIHTNFSYTRSWFQNPNTYDQQLATPWNGLNGIYSGVENLGGIGPNGQAVGPADQRSKIETFDIAPSWTHLIGANAVFTLGTFVRRDDYHYYPSGNPFSDLGPPSLQRQSVGQYRTLTNAGLQSSISYVKGIHNIKAGAIYRQTFLNENDQIGIVDPFYNAPCLTAGTLLAVPGIRNSAACAGAGYVQNTAANSAGSSLYPLYNPVLAPYDLTRGGAPYNFAGHTDVKELGLYVEDAITEGPWNFNVGIRGDLYNGLTVARQAEPRLGAAYNIKKTNTVLRVSYARTLETPFNENLVRSSLGCANAVTAPLLSCSAAVPSPLSPGYRNEFHAGLEQAFGKYLVFSGEYIWKYTHNAFDFSVLGNTPITFPIEWNNSKIPGFAGRVSVPTYRGFSAQVVFSSVAARYFTPQIGGAGSVPAVSGSGIVPFRIDHDERFNQSTHLQYQIGKSGPWIGFDWRFDSGLVAGASPCFGLSDFNTCPGSMVSAAGTALVSMVAANAGAVPLSADQEFEAGLYCGAQRASVTQALPSVCPASQFGSTLIRVPAPGTENDDRNPPRIAPRNTFDVSVGDDNLFRLQHDRYRVSVVLTAINITNKYALYNFLSTFSGTHYVSPRALTAEIGFHF
ncbi:MAG TPA: TonB-dependent receptor [Candidatus Sulfotelmatobacter sp.]|nr:TonB-dependent receptor [Candidatus Sulfotelmatobacter sp.]